MKHTLCLKKMQSSGPRTNMQLYSLLFAGMQEKEPCLPLPQVSRLNLKLDVGVKNQEQTKNSQRRKKQRDFQIKYKVSLYSYNHKKRTTSPSPRHVIPCPEVTSDEERLKHERQNLNKCMRQCNLGIQKNPLKKSLKVLIIYEKIVNATTLRLRSPCMKTQHTGTLYEIHSGILAWLLKWQKDIAGESGDV